jgi:hydroxymethylglutaryl-CoA synthase
MPVEPTFRRLGNTQTGVIEYGTIFRPRNARPDASIVEQKHRSEKAGIVGYGACIPYFRIRVADVATARKEDPVNTVKSTLYEEKAVPAYDQDSACMGVDASRDAVHYAGVSGENIGAVYFGSESKPYAVKPSAITIAEALGATPNVKAYDIESACKAATSSIPDAIAVVDNPGFDIEYALVVGSDNSQAAEHDALDPMSGAAAAAVLIGHTDVIASIEAYSTYTTDTPDFWRIDGELYPRHGGRFTGEPAYFRHIIGACEQLLENTGLRPYDFDHVVFHQPTGRFPITAAKRLGFEIDKLELGFTGKLVGNSYSAAGMLGLCNILDHAGDNERILLAQFGSGAGADAFSLMTEEPILEKRSRSHTVESQLAHKSYVDYHTYRKRKSGH